MHDITSLHRPPTLFRPEKTLWESSDLIEFGPLPIVCMPRQQDGEWKIEESRLTDAVSTQNRSRPVPIIGEDSRTGD